MHKWNPESYHCSMTVLLQGLIWFVRMCRKKCFVFMCMCACALNRFEWIMVPGKFISGGLGLKPRMVFFLEASLNRITKWKMKQIKWMEKHVTYINSWVRPVSFSAVLVLWPSSNPTTLYQLRVPHLYSVYDNHTHFLECGKDQMI